MIKENELRIGNYVYSLETNDVQKITGITEEIPFIDTITFDYPSYEEIEPIPLTEEWLLKLGFELTGSFYRIKNSRFVEVILHDNGIDVCNHTVCLTHIKYVHQLQNLYLCLTGAELTVA